MINSFVLTPEYFNLPENGNLVKESGIENRFDRAFEKVDPHFSVNKDDDSDGVIRYELDGKILFYGIQECKRSCNKNDSIYSMFAQSLAYVFLWLKQYPELKPLFKFVFLSTDKAVNIVYLDKILNSEFWWQFGFFYEKHRDSKGSPSNFYRNSPGVRALIADYINRFDIKSYVIGNSLDFKTVVEEILNNCL